MNVRRAVVPVVCLLVVVGSALAQHRVDPFSMYARIYAIVPMIGSGTWDDPKRPMFAPRPQDMTPGSRTGVIAYNHVESDDGNFALVEIVTVDRPHLALITGPITTSTDHRGLQLFDRSTSSQATVQGAFQALKKNFDITNPRGGAVMRASVLAVFAAFVVGPALFGTGHHALLHRQPHQHQHVQLDRERNPDRWFRRMLNIVEHGRWLPISKVSVPDGSSNYEVKTVLTPTQSGGTYVTYLRASTNALSGPTAAGTAYVFEVQNPTFSGASCSATLGVYKLISNAVTSLASTTIPCNNGMTIRAIYTAIGGQIVAYVNNIAYFWTEDSSIASGQPGIGGAERPLATASQEVQLGGIYVGNPVFPSDEIAVSAFANKVEIQWPGGSEGTSGPGVAFYEVFKNGTDIWNPYDGSLLIRPYRHRQRTPTWLLPTTSI